MYFLGRALRHSGASFYKLSLFRRGKGRFECRLKDQDASMADMEVHEHVVRGRPRRTAKLKNPLLHHNVESLSRYIQKHDEYSNWEARVLAAKVKAMRADLPPALFGIAGAASPLAAEKVVRTSRVRQFCSSSTSIFFASDFWMAFRA